MSEQNPIEKKLRLVRHLVIVILGLSAIMVALLIYPLIDPSLALFTSSEKEGAATEENLNLIENGVHVRTGLIEAEGLMAVVNNCTNCHSAQLVIQNRMNAKQWENTIRWMQRTQNLWELGNQEALIINYLTKNYPPSGSGRRKHLAEIEWYRLED